MTALSIASTDAAQAQTSTIEQALRSALERTGVPGAVALVTDRERVLYLGAVGVADVASRRPLAVDAMFRIASMTKPVTSLAAMQLIERGRFALDDPVAKYLPEMGKLPVLESFDATTGVYRLRPAKRPITVRHLLTHTSGLGYRFVSPTLRDLKLRPGDAPNGMLLFDPGEQWIYGTSTDVVGRLVEKVSGQTLATYFRRRILAPLKMNDTFYNVPKEKAARLVAVHQRAGPRLDGRIVLPKRQPARRIVRPSGGGGLVSTASDYGRFVRMLLNGGTLDGARVLKAETVALMGRNHIGSVTVPALKSTSPRSADFNFIADGRDKWGLGFLITTDQVRGKRSPGSLSWAGINNTYFWVDPKRAITGVILMQYVPFADAGALAVYDAFERAVYRTIGTR
jgi:CubicO group peptidase (beta-lactamase class C family)